MARAWSAEGRAHAKEAGMRGAQLEASLDARGERLADYALARQHQLPPLQEEPES